MEGVHLVKMKPTSKGHLKKAKKVIPRGGARLVCSFARSAD
jgi:hypothetical protein